MSKLQSITRGNTSPQGKPRVYFCAHPREQGEFLPAISRQLLEQCNCAVWYDSEPEEPCNWEDFSLELSQMQLFVVPVTERLLTRPNRAADQEIPFALEHHIPVLPLLQELGLETTFGQRFGDLQFLDAAARDITAIPFEEKLKKFLASILIGDELAAQVRAAFDAYIFLSYRKKDRREAQKLMGLIHQNEFFRSIAIWYDEFLTPGEHFNEAIAEALIKSKLFTLVVTPSLLEQPNYVMSTEYPMAQKSGTPILPVEMVPTDRRGLEDCYDAVPDCASGEDAPALTECLLDLLRDVAVRPHDQDPRHNYLMGLAYLTGIDVEVNQERARQLIQGSAEQGYEPAMEKLVTMYRSGEGVARNMQQAIDWQKRLVESREQAWEAHQTEKAYRLLTDALWQLGDFYREQEDLQGWRWVWEQKMLPLNQRVEAQYPFAAVQRHLFSLAYVYLGELSEMTGDLSAARTSYTSALELSSRLCQEEPTLEHRWLLAVCYAKMGELCRMEGDLPGARTYYEHALDLDKQLDGELAAQAFRRSLFCTYENLGDISMIEGDLPAARRFYELAMEIIRQLAEEFPTLPNRRDLASGYERMGNISWEDQDPAAARKFYERSMQLNQELTEEAPTPESRRSLAIDCDRLADLSQKEGDLQTARRLYERAMVLREALAEAAATVENRRNLLVSYERLGYLSSLEQDLSAARRFYEQAIAVGEGMVQESPTPEHRRDLLVLCRRTGKLCERTADLSGAIRFYGRALELRQQFAQETPSQENRKDVSDSCQQLGQLCEKTGDLAGARRFYELGLTIDAQLTEECPTQSSRWNLSVGYNRLGRICGAERNWTDARRYFGLALELKEQLAEEEPRLANRRSLSLCCEQIGDVDRLTGEFADARRFYERALDIGEQLLRESPTLDYRQDVSIRCGKLGLVCMETKDFSGARDYFARALALEQGIPEQSRTARDWDRLAIACFHLGVLEDSCVRIQRALEIWTDLSEQYPSVPSYAQKRDMVRSELERR